MPAAAIWFLAGVVTTVVALLALSPLLRAAPRLSPLQNWPRAALLAVLGMLAIGPGLCLWLYRSEPVQAIVADSAAEDLSAAPLSSLPLADVPAALAGSAEGNPDDTVQGATARDSAAGAASSTPAASSAAAGAGSMQTAVTRLESRLATRGGSDADWELLAQSYEFMGRHDDAVRARARRLPELGR